MKLKLFVKANPLARKGENRRVIEDEINDWLARHPNIRIVDIQQSASGGGGGAGTMYAIGSALYMTVWYEDV